MIFKRTPFAGVLCILEFFSSFLFDSSLCVLVGLLLGVLAPSVRTAYIKSMKQMVDNQRVFRVNFKAYLARLGAGRFILAAIIIAGYFFLRPSQGWFVLIGVAIGLGLAFYHITQRKILLSDAEIVASGGLLRRRAIARTSLAAHYFPHYKETNFGIFERLLLRDTQTGAKISINGLYWGLEELAEIRTLIKRKNEIIVYNEPITNTELAKKFPYYLGYIERRPYVSAGLIVLGVVAIVTVMVAFLHML